MARHADIVLPSTMTLERNDIGGSMHDPCLVAMHQAVAPYEQSRNDYETFAAVAAALGVGEQFTEGRTEMEWIAHLYDDWRAGVAQFDVHLPSFEKFWRDGFFELPQTEPSSVLFSAFRADPERAPLNTPSGRIEIFSATVDGFHYDDCAGHPKWYEPAEWLGSPAAEVPARPDCQQPADPAAQPIGYGRVQPVVQSPGTRARPRASR